MPVFLSQFEVRLGSILKALVIVELQLCSDHLFFLGCPYGVEDKIDRLHCCGLVDHDAVVIEIADHGEVKESLPGWI